MSQQKQCGEDNFVVLPLLSGKVEGEKRES